MIDVAHLSYAYSKDGRKALDDVSFQVETGETFGFLGPSGAGKSTTQGILTGLLPIQTGEGTVAGYDLRHITRAIFNQIGVSFEQSNVYGKLTALENLEFYRRLFDVPTLDPLELLRLVGLEDVKDKRAATFSKGMKHRLTFARSMINQPSLWFLDEPTTGLDPAIANTIKDIIRERSEAGTTVFLTTHNMYIADELCHRVGFIVDGVLKLVDTPRNLKLRYGDRRVEVETLKDGQVVTAAYSLDREAERLALNEVIREGRIQRMHTKEPTLEEIFIRVTGRELT